MNSVKPISSPITSTSGCKMLNVKLWPNWLKAGIFVTATLSVFGVGYTGVKYYCKRKGGCKIGGGGSSPPPFLGQEIIIPLIGKKRHELENIPEEASISSANVIEL